MKSNSLELEALVVARDGAELTPPMTLVLQAGEMLAVHGGNGSGKSTLLKTIAGLIRIHSGSIRIGGQWPAAEHPLYMGHKRGLTPNMSVYDNVALWGKLSGHSELIAAALHYFDLEDIVHTQVAELSAGWQQRVAFTRLITMPACVWLLDEPTANLDGEAAGLLQSLIQTRLEQGGVVVAATHAHFEGEKIKTMNLNSLNINSKVDC